MAEERMNLAALQQRDPYINDIVDTASQVALYSFSAKANEWEKTSIEGSLFVYKRSASPNNGFMILNRLGLNNLIEPITKDLEFQLQDPFLLYRNAKAIYGIWFYDKDECARIGQLMNSLLQLAIGYQRAKSDMRQRRASESDSIFKNMENETQKNVDILQMLSKAQHEYDKTKCTLPKGVDPKPFIDNPNASATKASNLIRPKPLKIGEVSEEGPSDSNSSGAGPPVPATAPATAPISLETLFRNATLQQQNRNRNDLPKPPSFHRSVSMSEGLHPSQEGEEDLTPLLKHIMSSGSMVEEIERQHRKEPSNKEFPPPHENTSKKEFPPHHENNPKNLSAQGSNLNSFFLNEASDCVLPEASNSPDSSNKLNESVNRSVTDKTHLEKRRKKSPNINSNQDTEKKENLLTPGALLQHFTLGAEGTSNIPMLPPMTSDVLLTPMAFVTHSPKSSSPATTVRTQDSSEDLPVAALTKEQLQQALIHLIKNDSSFIDSIHQAYLNSLKDLSSHKT